MVFAICCPDLDVSCVDTVAKKAAFIQQAAAASEAVPARPACPGRKPGWPVRRGELPRDLRAGGLHRGVVAPALAPHGVWLAMKGKTPADEIDALPVT